MRSLYRTYSASIFPINKNHSNMVKFCKGDLNCQVVLGKLKEICKHQKMLVASGWPKSCMGSPSKGECPQTVLFGRNRDFVGCKLILTALLKRIPPNANKDNYQQTAIKGLKGVGKIQIVLKVAFHIRNYNLDYSIFQVLAVNAISFKNAYYKIGQELGVERINKDKADVKVLIKIALSQRSAGSWLLIIDNANDPDLLFNTSVLAKYLPFSQNGSILFTIQNYKIAVTLDILERNIITTIEIDKTEATMLL